MGAVRGRSSGGGGGSGGRMRRSNRRNCGADGGGVLAEASMHHLGQLVLPAAQRRCHIVDDRLDGLPGGRRSDLVCNSGSGGSIEGGDGRSRGRDARPVRLGRGRRRPSQLRWLGARRRAAAGSSGWLRRPRIDHGAGGGGSGRGLHRHVRRAAGGRAMHGANVSRTGRRRDASGGRLRRSQEGAVRGAMVGVAIVGVGGSGTRH